MKQYDLFINGEFVQSSAGVIREVRNPATEEVVSLVQEATIDDTRRAIQAAADAQSSWAGLPAIQRANYLTQIAARIRDNMDYLAQVISEEQGKILSMALGEVSSTADYLEYMAGWARRIEGEIIPSDRPNENIFLFRKPIGVVAGILPWNFPFFLIARKMAPALITGNTIVIKPSEETPNNAFEFAKIVAECNLPKGVFNVVSGNGATVGAELASNPQIGLITFTGSVETGTSIMKAAADNITKVSLELGGKAPAIVMDDADIDLAVRCIRLSRIGNAGQVCNCAERIYVHEAVLSEFTDKMVEAMTNTTYGDPLSGEVDMGPLINREQLSKVETIVERAVQEGATVAIGGKRAPTQKGHYFEPTVLLNCKQEMEITHKEIFGPVLPIIPFRDLEEAISMANDSSYGLTSSIYTKSLEVMMRAANELKFGETYVNRENNEAIQAFHSGWRKSGLGGDDGKHGLEEFLQWRVVYVQY